MRAMGLLSVVLMGGLASCRKGEGQEGAAGPMPAMPVSVEAAKEEKVVVKKLLPGRVVSYREAEVRARVAGILMEKLIAEGKDVEAGAVLFRIDPEPLQAAKESAEASLGRAKAAQEQAQTLLKRYESLVGSHAVSQQDLDDAVSAERIAAAEVRAAEAQVKTASLNLGYATVTAPIAGRAGRAEVTEGALVGQGDVTLLTVIRQLDPIYVDFTQSVGDLQEMREWAKEGGEGEKVVLRLGEGREFKHTGKVLFSEARVDESTGMVTLRAEFPNPEKELLPGMFARVEVVQRVKDRAVTVPQRALVRAQGGQGRVLVVNDQDVAESRMVTTSEAIGDRWVVESGLKAGETVVVEGHLKVAMSQGRVKPMPWVDPAKGGATPN